MFRRRFLSLQSSSTRASLFSTSARPQANRAIVYSQNGRPADVVRALTVPDLTAPSPKTVNVRFVLSPINPADVNVIEGVYPSKPRPSSFPGVTGDVFVGGNEALAEVTYVGQGVRTLGRGDWVVMKARQVGTWRSAANLREDQLLKVPRLKGLSEVNAATMMVRSLPFTRRWEGGRPRSYDLIFELFFFATHTHRSTLRVRTAFCRTLSL